eukprot:CAMPEP_0177625492 /NCGR_PEP_ID=MMETSP0419_2-20121207/30131_1 /TAXON_ID=582737 /ORGANISM="Tetraselmis sp., Strain GSL018" /LENGTH=267 /DNA_ID=CAMNT_0019126447 /DNA_START=342 /DNA_END=1143 /DNA_ORIENTATION=+
MVLSKLCGDLQTSVRVGKLRKFELLPQGECFQHLCKLSEFCDWLEDNEGCGHQHDGCQELSRLDKDDFFAYLDYKYFHEFFVQHEDLRTRAVDWDRFGDIAKGVLPEDSVLWIGSAGASTPLHQDSYGANLVAQLYGEKQWTLFCPDTTSALQPTRIPYEESSVYSQLSAGEVDALPGLRVTLVPGDVLYVPHGWWHQVRSLSTSISVNVWVPRPGDDRARVEEATVKAVLASLMGAAAAQGGRPPAEPPAECLGWLNPNEGPVALA